MMSFVANCIFNLVIATTIVLAQSNSASAGGIRAKVVHHNAITAADQIEQKEDHNDQSPPRRHKRKLQNILDTILDGIGILDNFTNDGDGSTENSDSNIGGILDTLLDLGEVFNDVEDTTENASNIFENVDGIISNLESLCFSSHNSVEVEGKGMVSMDTIQVGDYVRVSSPMSSLSGSSNNNGFSRVFSLAHIDHEFEADFIQLHYYDYEAKENTESSEYVAAEASPTPPLEITAKHMVYVSGRGAVRADQVKVGDLLLQPHLDHLDDGDSDGKVRTVVVNEISSIKRKGVYAPVTESGDIIVSGVLASSYYAFLDGVSGNVQHTLTHFFFAPHRSLCTYYDFGLCLNETHSADGGYTNWAYWAIKTMSILNKVLVYTPIQWLLVFVSFPILLSLYLMEQMIMTTVVLVLPFTASNISLVTIPFVYATMMHTTKVTTK